MPKTQDRTISLTPEQVAFIDAQVVHGDFETGDDVVREGIRLLQERKARMEKWLREEVLPAAIEMEKHPERAIPMDEAFEYVEAQILAHAARKKA